MLRYGSAPRLNPPPPIRVTLKANPQGGPERATEGGGDGFGFTNAQRPLTWEAGLAILSNCATRERVVKHLEN